MFSQSCFVEIRADDFKSIELKSYLVNLTSKGGGNRKLDRGPSEAGIPFVVNEFTDKGLILECPVRTCAQGHALLVNIATLNAPKNATFSATAKVMNTEQLDENFLRVEVEFFQYDEVEWQGLKNVYSTRQTEVLDLFRSIRGY